MHFQLVLRLFPLLDDLLEIFFSFFGLLSVLHGILDLNFKLYAFCYQWAYQGGD
jgi:hypothetical protein